jgi:hypothetical protein
MADLQQNSGRKHIRFKQNIRLSIEELIEEPIKLILRKKKKTSGLCNQRRLKIIFKEELKKLKL